MDKLFIVMCDELDPDGECEIEAIDHKEAAEKWAEDWESDGSGYMVEEGNIIEVKVKGINENKWRIFDVSGERFRVYDAREKRK